MMTCPFGDGSFLCFLDHSFELQRAIFNVAVDKFTFFLGLCVCSNGDGGHDISCDAEVDIVGKCESNTGKNTSIALHENCLCCAKCIVEHLGEEQYAEMNKSCHWGSSIIFKKSSLRTGFETSCGGIRLIGFLGSDRRFSTCDFSFFA